jgi:hypothetical protein
VFVPNDSFDAYSYASEHRDDDAVIASLPVCAAGFERRPNAPRSTLRRLAID